MKKKNIPAERKKRWQTGNVSALIPHLVFIHDHTYTSWLAHEQVEFRYKAQFKGNKALRDGDYDAGDGGGLCVASRGEVSFDDHSYFTENEAESGGSGGAIANYGYLAFKRASYLTLNVAKGKLTD